MTVGTAISYVSTILSPVGPTVGVLGVCAVVYACTYAKKPAIITWPGLETVAWHPGIFAAHYQKATLNHAECALAYRISPGSLDEALDAGTYTLTATAAETPGYHPASASATFTIAKARPEIIWSKEPIHLTYPEELREAELNARVDGFDGEVTHSHAAGRLKPGKYQVVATFTPVSGNVETCTAMRELFIAMGDIILTWAAAREIDYDGDIFDAKPDVAGGKCTYSYMEKKGSRTLAGSTGDLKVRQLPYEVTAEYRLDGYKVAKATCAVTVKPAPIPIAWPAPAPIPYGTKLSETQLNADTPLFCKPTYKNATTGKGIQKGTMLEGGAHLLAVTFETSDPNYLPSATLQVTLQVTPVVPAIDWPATEISDGRLVDTLYAGLAARHAGNGTPADGNFDNFNPPLGTPAAMPGPLLLSVDFAPANTDNYQPVAGSTHTVHVVRVTAAEIAHAKISPAMRDKILTGEIDGGVLIGAHSRSILVDPAFTVGMPVVHPDGSATYTVRKTMPGGGHTPPKTSTLPPAPWNDDDILRATVDTVATPVVQVRATDGAKLHKLVVNGVHWSVITDSSDNVTMACPTAANFAI